MRRRPLALSGLVMAAAVAAFAAWRRGGSRAVEDLYGLPLDRTDPRQYGTFYGGAPFVSHRSDVFQTIHAASLDALRDLLPSPDLHPVRLLNGRAAISVSVLQHFEMTANGVAGFATLPYAEVIIAALVSRRPAPPFLPLVAPPALGIAAGAFALHLAVTTRPARDAGRLIWGLPKFVADMEFDESIATRRVRLSEAGRVILTLTTHPAGRPSVARESQAFYGVLGDELIEILLPSHQLRQVRWGPAGGELVLGDHPVADELRALDIAPRPFLTIQESGVRAAMPMGRPIGAARPYIGYVGADRDLGRYVVRFPNTAPIDRYAMSATTSGSKAPRRRVEAAPGRRRSRDAS